MAADQLRGPTETFSAASAAAASSLLLSLTFHAQYFQLLTDTVLNSISGADEGRGPLSSPRSAPEALLTLLLRQNMGLFRTPLFIFIMCKYSEPCSRVRQRGS